MYTFGHVHSIYSIVSLESRPFHVTEFPIHQHDEKKNYLSNTNSLSFSFPLLYLLLLPISSFLYISLLIDRSDPLLKSIKRTRKKREKTTSNRINQVKRKTVHIYFGKHLERKIPTNLKEIGCKERSSESDG